MIRRPVLVLVAIVFVLSALIIGLFASKQLAGQITGPRPSGPTLGCGLGPLLVVSETGPLIFCFFWLPPWITFSIIYFFWSSVPKELWQSIKLASATVFLLMVSTINDVAPDQFIPSDFQAILTLFQTVLGFMFVVWIYRLPLGSKWGTRFRFGLITGLLYLPTIMAGVYTVFWLLITMQVIPATYSVQNRMGTWSLILVGFSALIVGPLLYLFRIGSIRPKGVRK